ncbi:RBBP9/YdeN family alpha/beta hydrolase [Streptomyces sp. NPDC049040]|uniref:RBBP9/YdeN family alpha/beta hydrolase n=1 Tax=Streptomyces sp. NPDC049040 TaxID=3365593 RepID=UPI0037248489
MTDVPGGHRFVILHGWQNRRPPGHWQHWLAARLAELGHEVAYPQLPDPDEPDLAVWLAALRALLAGPRRWHTVVCHSLACALWLHAVAREDTALAVERVLLVAPPSAGFLRQHPQVAAFAPPALAPGRAAAAGRTRIVCGDDDPCCPEGAATEFGVPLGLPVDIVAGGGHLTPDSGYGPWPSVLDWCLDPSGGAPLRGRGHEPVRGGAS